MLDLLWLVPVLPLLGALINGVLLRGRLPKKGVVAVACGSTFLSLVIGLGAIGSYLAGSEHAAGKGFEQILYRWISGGALNTTLFGVKNLEIDFGLLLDPLSAVMVFVVTFVGFWIHVYSVGYMAHEGGFQRYFTYLNLFMGAMLFLVLGNNYLVTFIGWEGVGLCSYLLIGFYYDQEFPPYAGRKAFIVNRIGDFAFLLGLFALVAHFGSLRYTEIFPAIAADPSIVTGPGWMGLSVAAFVALAFFIGATGKSAQIPLFVWLPDAMAGPTPVSALIHAATMVTAGVYMVVRSHLLFELAPGVSTLVAVVGALTAIFAATIGLAQTDIKKVLAYSTVSQLGYMFLAAGVGAYSAAIFHLGTHAFFKALLFLGSGSVIHAMSGEQDLRKMGGLWKVMPKTAWTFVIGALAIAGVPGLAGFFSKDAILAGAYDKSPWLWGIGVVTAALTAFYMFRLCWLAFGGSFRGTDEQREHLHESPASMTVPLGVLAFGAVFVGWLGPIPFLHKDWFGHFLAPSVESLAHGGHSGHHELSLEALLVGMSILAAFVGIAGAWFLYGQGRGLEGGNAWAERFPRIHRLLVNKYWVDELYDKTAIRGTWGLARWLYRFDAFFIDGLLVNGTRHLTVGISLISGFFDQYVVDGLVNLTAAVLQAGSRVLSRLQTGQVSQYASGITLGVIFILCLYVIVG